VQLLVAVARLQLLGERLPLLMVLTVALYIIAL
jgi:hypothetical protein